MTWLDCSTLRRTLATFREHLLKIQTLDHPRLTNFPYFKSLQMTWLVCSTLSRTWPPSGSTNRTTPDAHTYLDVVHCIWLGWSAAMWVTHEPPSGLTRSLYFWFTADNLAGLQHLESHLAAFREHLQGCQTLETHTHVLTYTITATWCTADDLAGLQHLESHLAAFREHLQQNFHVRPQTHTFPFTCFTDTAQRAPTGMNIEIPQTHTLTATWFTADDLAGLQHFESHLAAFREHLQDFSNNERPQTHTLTVFWLPADDLAGLQHFELHLATFTGHLTVANLLLCAHWHLLHCR
jgi:hypothetical protein